MAECASHNPLLGSGEERASASHMNTTVDAASHRQPAQSPGRGELRNGEPGHSRRRSALERQPTEAQRGEPRPSARGAARDVQHRPARAAPRRALPTSARVLGGAATLALAAAASPALARDGIALNRFEPAEAGSQWLAADSLDISGHLRPSVGLVSDWAHKALVVYDENGEEVAVPSRDQVYLHARGSLTLLGSVRLAISAPLLAFQRGEGVAYPSGEAIDVNEQPAMGDLRTSVDVRVLGEPGGPLILSLGTSVYLPTGSEAELTGEGVARIRPRAQIAGETGPLVYAAHAAAQVRGDDKRFAGRQLGSEAYLGAALGYQWLDERLLTGLVVNSATALGADAFDEGTTALEGQLCAQLALPEGWRVGAAVGAGLGEGVGAPLSRVMLALQWDGARPEAPPPPPSRGLPSERDGDGDGDGVGDDRDACPSQPGPDSLDATRAGCALEAAGGDEGPARGDADGDGVRDEADACPGEPGPIDTDPEKTGCPSPVDSDGDGIDDPLDACPNRAGPGEGSETPGCPPDRDGDAVPDSEDACPEEPGPTESVDPARIGCPVADRDGDGVEDGRDACPEKPAPGSADGCPAARPSASALQRQRIEFELGKAHLTRDSELALQAVVDLLEAHPEVALLRIEGHSDNRGAAALNQRVSEQRARAVLKWLVAHGVASSRLEAVGRGSAHPVAPNDTERGRQANRRVQFTIAKRAPTADDAKPEE